MNKLLFSRGRLVPALVGVGLVAGLATGGRLLASDHQDTPEVELSQRFDVNDVYAFPAATSGRIVLVLGTSSPITPAGTPSFAFGTKDEELYQIKVDNTGDAVEDLVFQVTFSGSVNEVLGSASGIQLFAGPRDDPFFIDLEQFFRIIPDRKPVTGPLSQLPSTPTASSFRAAGLARDYVRGFNDMAIVIELPTSMLAADPQHPGKFGVWGTTSRARAN